MRNHTAFIEGDDELIFSWNFSSTRTIMAASSPNSLYLDPTVDQAASIRCNLVRLSKGEEHLLFPRLALDDGRYALLADVHS